MNSLPNSFSNSPSTLLTNASNLTNNFLPNSFSNLQSNSLTTNESQLTSQKSDKDYIMENRVLLEQLMNKKHVNFNKTTNSVCESEPRVNIYSQVEDECITIVSDEKLPKDKVIISFLPNYFLNLNILK